MKASQLKETRPHNGSSSAGAPSERSFSTHKKDNTTGKPFSKPGRTGEKAVAGASGSGRSSKQGSLSHDTKDTKGKSHGATDPSKTGTTGALDPATVASRPAKIKKPKAPKPPLDPNEHISQRAFIGGLAKDVTTSDMEGRFKSFGQIKDVYLAKDVDGACRGFGYVTLDTTRKEWQKCVTLFNGAKWKGNVMKIEEANKDWQTKRQEDLEAQTVLEKKQQDAAQKKLKKNPTRYADNMSLVTEKNMDGRRGWKRGRYGRPVITMKLDNMTYDPSHYKNNVEKLFNVPGKPLPLDQLTYWIDEDEPVPKGKHLSTEAALAAFRSRSTTQPTFTSTDTTQKSALHGKMESLSITNPQTQREEPQDASNDRAMMASILAGMDMSPRALSLDGSDIDEDDEGMYAEDLGALQDTTAGDLFEGVVPSNNTATAFSRTERDSRPEDLFGDDDDNESRVNQPLLSFLEDDNEDDDEDEDEEMKSADDEDDEDDEDSTGEDEDDGEDEDEMDDDTIEAITQLHNTSSTSAGGLFDSDNDDDDQDTKDSTQAKAIQESNTARLKALESRQAELEAAREKQNNLIASTLANIDSRDKKAGHVVFSDSDDYDSEDYEKMEADHAKKMASLNKPAKSIFDSDSGSDDEQQQTLPVSKKKGVKEMFDSDDEDADIGADKLGGHDLNIKEQFEGPGGKALFKMQTKIGTSDSRFQLTKDFLDDRIREEDDADYVAHQDLLKAEQAASSGNSGIVLDEDRQAESDVAAEKMQLMNVLRSMFGDSAVKSKKKEEDTARQARGGLGFTTGLAVRYDPDTAPPPQPLPPPTVPATQASKTSTYDSDSDAEDDASEHHSDQEDEEDKEEDDSQEEEEENEGSTGEDAENDKQDTQPSKKSVRFSFAFDAEDLNSDDKSEGDKTETTSTASSTATKKNLDISTKFQVASDLKSLFAPSTGTFKLFGGDDDDDDDEEEKNDQADDVEDDRPVGSMEEDRSQDEILTSYTDGARTIFTSGADAFNRTPLSHSGTLFFFHFKNPSLLTRSNFKTSNKVFMRTTSMDEVTAHWEKTRRAMTQEFKRKHKSASRNKARASKRLKTTGSEGGRSGGGDHSDLRS